MIVAWCKLPSNWNQEARYYELLSTLKEHARSLPCDLWAYCAANAPDGNIARFSAAALAEAIRYRGPCADAMIAALKSAGYVSSSGDVIGWRDGDELYRLYETLKEKARKASNAAAEKRRAKTGSDGNGDGDGDGEDKVAPKDSSKDSSKETAAFKPLVLSAEERRALQSEYSLYGDTIDRRLEEYNEERKPWVSKDGPPNLPGFRNFLRKSKAASKGGAMR